MKSYSVNIFFRIDLCMKIPVVNFNRKRKFYHYPVNGRIVVYLVKLFIKFYQRSAL